GLTPMLRIPLAQWCAPDHLRAADRGAAQRRAARGTRSLPRLERLQGRTLPCVITPFTVRSSADVTGDSAIVGNTLETASTVGNPAARSRTRSTPRTASAQTQTTMSRAPSSRNRGSTPQLATAEGGHP